jgi:hypothetical protein
MDVLDLPRDVLDGYDWGAEPPASSLRSGVGEC